VKGKDKIEFKSDTRISKRGQQFEWPTKFEWP